jgi:fused signal recognition particle receptor
MVGVNGAGKTTTIGKLAAKLQAEGKQISFIAADTFRAAAVEQLQIWAERNHIRIFSGPNGCDSAGLCYDGLNAAIKAGDDVVFIDTAGRLQNKSGLMEELKKIVRVMQKIMPDAPHRVLLTIDATTGQNALAQVETFKQIVGVNGLIVTKLDGTAKGGILVAIAKEHQLPIYFIGIGEQIADLDVFKAREFSRSLLNLEN